MSSDKITKIRDKKTKRTLLFLWIPSHVGIKCNLKVFKSAKQTITKLKGNILMQTNVLKAGKDLQ